MRLFVAWLWLFAGPLFAQTPVTFNPTTTLAAETGNNTSASATFAAQANGNAAGSSNMSKLAIRPLLYSGTTTNIYAHLEVWFGQSSHINVGYSSSDPVEVHRQAQDMISRGISGAVVDWYGQNFVNEDNATLAVKKEAEQQAGQWTFALMYDAGALNTCASTSGCSVTEQVISDLQYAYLNYFGSSGYLRYSGQPIVFFFGVDQFAIDWNTVRSSVPGDPLYVFEYTGSSGNGFAHAQANGGFAWQSVSGTTSTDTGLAYLDNFYSSALSFPLLLPYGSGYKGFNDSLAPWAPNPPRVMEQNCGQTWLASLAETGKYYSASNQLLNLQIVTWNDYEEGSEIETGIDNCVTPTASISSSTLSWTLAGSESTVDHYTVFLSQDGSNLMSLRDVPAGTHSLDLSQYNFGSTTYTFFVKAVGKPTLLNHMSNGVTYNQSDRPPTAQLTISPTSGTAPLTVNASTSGSSDPDGTISSSSIDFGDGTVVNGTSASHVYNNAGSFVVTGTVTDNAGLKSSTQTTVTVSPASTSGPQAVLSASPANGVAPLAVSASLSGSTDSTGNITNYTFNWGDGSANTSGSSATATHSYANAGNYTLTGTVTDNKGKTSSATQGISVAVSGVTITSPANGSTVTSPVHVVASASAPNQPITSMKVYVDNVDTYTVFTNNINTNITMSVGSHQITINAWDGAGNVYQSSVGITVSSQVQDKPPVAMLKVTPTSGGAPLLVSASTSGSYDPDGTVTHTTINWGDGSVVTGPNADHTYQAGGTYTVTATAYDNSNSTGTTSTVVTVGANTPPVGALESASISNGSVTVSGWAADKEDGAPVNQVQVFVDGYLFGNAVLGGTRTDIATKYNDTRYTNSGWTLTTSASGLASGQHTATAIAYDSGGATVLLGPVTISTGSATALPTALKPFSGTGALQTFAFTFSDASGYADISTAQAQFSTGGAGGYLNNCSVAYDRANNELYLQNDSGSGWQGPITMGSAGTLSNSQCTIDGGSSSASGSATTLTVGLAVAFSSSFARTTNVFGWAQNAAAQNSGWVQLGTWNTTAVLAANEVSPSSGTGSSRTFTFAYSDPNGYADMTTTQAQFTGGGAGGYVGNCSIAYSRASNQLYLQNDTGSGWQGPVTIGGAGTLSNSQCTVDAGTSSASGSGNILTVSIGVTFTNSFSGTKNVFSWVQNGASQNSGWRQVGTWNTGATLSAAQVSPSVGAGGTQTFLFTYTDPSGYTDITTTQAEFGTTAGAYVNDCATAYDRVHNQLYLQNDAGAGWVGPGLLGTAGTLSNSQCSIDLGASSATGSGNLLQVSLAVTFGAGFTGTQSVFSWVQNGTAQTSGWSQVGTWNTAVVLAATGVTPNSGNASTQTFAFQYTDPNGYGDIMTTQAMFGFATNSYVGVCATAYTPSTHQLYLQNDAGAGWLGPMTLGTANTLSNSQCSISGAGSSASGTGTTLTLNLAVTFGAGQNPSTWQSTPNKNIFGWVQNAASQTSGWRQLGVWRH